MNRIAVFIIGLFWSASLVYADNTVRDIAVADGSLTEIVYALGAENRLLAVDSSSTYPEAATQLPNIGYMRALSAEGVLSVKPRKLLTTASAGPHAVLDQIRQAGVELFVINNDFTIEGLLHKVETLAAVLGKVEQGRKLENRIRERMQTLTPALDGSLASVKPRVLFFMNMQGNQLMAAGDGTQGDALIRLLHGVNLMAGTPSYKVLSQEALLALDPDVIVVATDMKQAGVNADAAFQQTRAYKNRRVVIADTALLLGFGPRLPEALQLMAAAFYPGKIQ